MNNTFRYPKILCDGELEAFNDRITRLLGTPIFFTAPAKLFRPKATDEIGALYEVISGLYVVYHDYGIRLFRTYREFCQDHVPQVGFAQNDGFSHRDPSKPSNHEFVATQVRYHCINVDDLRGGFFHGCLPNASEEKKLRCVLNRMLSGGVWPDDLAALTASQARTLLNRLANDSDKMFEYFERCAAVIADPANGGLLADWRGTLIQKVFNPDDPQYSNGEPYFDGRTIKDIENSVKMGGNQQPHQESIQKWLRSLEEPIRKGTLTSAQLHSTLQETFLELYDPSNFSGASTASTLLGASAPQNRFSGSSMANLLGADTLKQLLGE